MKYGPIPIVLLMILSCSSDETKRINLLELKGKWVEVATRMNTLSFEFSDNMEIMKLLRGKEIIDGKSLPKSG